MHGNPRKSWVIGFQICLYLKFTLTLECKQRVNLRSQLQQEIGGWWAGWWVGWWVGCWGVWWEVVWWAGASCNQSLSQTQLSASDHQTANQSNLHLPSCLAQPHFHSDSSCSLHFHSDHFWSTNFTISLFALEYPIGICRSKFIYCKIVGLKITLITE